jgi:2-phospho-L-lactate guanylyltransferase
MPQDPVPHGARRDGGRNCGVVLPLRSFTSGKARLATELDANAHAHFVREMAERVADAAGTLPVVVVSSAPEVVAWASDRGHECLPDPGSLDAAASIGRDHLRDLGYARVVVAHGDLPLARTLDPVTGDGDAPRIAIVPCHRDDGTPVLSVPAAAPFRFAYGPGSFARHCAEAERAGLEVCVVRDPTLSFDVDVAADLALLDERRSARCP